MKMVNTEEEDDEFICCDLCNLLFNDVKTYEKHKTGSKHLKNEKTLRNKEILKLDGSEDDGADDIVCKVCDKTFSGIVPFKQHLKSGPHFKALKRQDLLEKSGTGIEDDADDSENENIVPKAYAHCAMCKKQFSGPESYMAHMISKAHKKKRREEKYLKLLAGSEPVAVGTSEAENADTTATASATGKPVQSEANQIEMVKRQLLQTAEDTLSDEESSEDKKFSCEQCGKSFSGPAPLMQHLVSKLHKKKLKQLKILQELKSKMTPTDSEKSDEEEADSDNGEILACVTCGMSFSGPESMMAHLKGKSHKKKIAFLKAKEKILKQLEDKPQTKVKHPPASAPPIEGDPEIPSNPGTSTQPKETSTSRQNDDDSNVRDPMIISEKPDPNRKNVDPMLEMEQMIPEKSDEPKSEQEGENNNDAYDEKRKKKRSNVKKVASAVLEIYKDI